MREQHPIQPYVLAEHIGTVLRGWRDPSTLPNQPAVTDDAQTLWQRFEALSALHDAEAAAQIAEAEYLTDYLTRAEQRGVAAATVDRQLTATESN